MENQRNDRNELLQTAFNAGLKVLSDDYCAKLLAWLYVYGGGSEQVVYDQELNADIKYAQLRANLIGGQIPDVKICKQIRHYVPLMEADNERRHVKWILGEKK